MSLSLEQETDIRHRDGLMWLYRGVGMSYVAIAKAFGVSHQNAARRVERVEFTLDDKARRAARWESPHIDRLIAAKALPERKVPWRFYGDLFAVEIPPMV